MDKVYYSPRGYWKGVGAINKLAKGARVSRDVAKEWLKKQAVWQIYLPPPRYIPRQHFDVGVPNKIHQADLLFLPHDKVRRKTYKYALTVVDVASRYKEAEPLTSKDSTEVGRAFERIYKRSSLKWPQTLQVDPGREFMGSVTTLLEKHNVGIRRGEKEAHRSQAIVERFNRTLSERLFLHQYGVEMNNPTKRSTEWVVRLPGVISALNNEVTRLIHMKPAKAIKLKYVSAQPAAPQKTHNPKIPSNANVRYLYQAGELEGGQRYRATDPVWSLKIYTIDRSIGKEGEPTLYYLEGGPRRGFVRKELLIVPHDTVLPP